MQEVTVPPEQIPHAFGQASRTKLRNLHLQSPGENLAQHRDVSLHPMQKIKGICFYPKYYVTKTIVIGFLPVCIILDYLKQL